MSPFVDFGTGSLVPLHGSQQVIPLNKARFVDVPSEEPDWKSIHRAADRFVGRFESTFIRAVERMRRRFKLSEITAALERGTVSGALPMNEWNEDFADLIPVFIDAFNDGGQQAARTLTQAIEDGRVGKQESGITFNMVNPESVSFAERAAFRRSMTVSRESQDAVRTIIGSSFRERFTVNESARRIREEVLRPDDMAQLIRNGVGLDRRRAGALARYRTGLIKRGFPRTRVKKLVRARAERLLRARARTIARHETLVAANAGQEALWNQAVATGDLPASQRRVWITTPDDRICPLCIPMDGRTAPLRGVWIHPFTQKPLQRPQDLHVTCRCAEGLSSRSTDAFSVRIDTLADSIRADSRLTAIERSHADILARSEVLVADELAVAGDSFTQFFDEATGTWDSSRRASHAKAFAAFNKDKTAWRYKGRLTKDGKIPDDIGWEDRPTAIIMGGPAAAGKTSAVGKFIDLSNKVVINSDDFKEFMIGYRGYNAGVVHRESSFISKSFLDRTIRLKQNVVLDTTMGSKKDTLRNIGLLREAGYRIEFRFVHVSNEVSFDRAMKRFFDETMKTGQGRYVPTKFLRWNADPKWETQSRVTYEELKVLLRTDDEHFMDAYQVFMNNESNPVLIESVGTFIKGLRRMTAKLFPFPAQPDTSLLIGTPVDPTTPLDNPVAELFRQMEVNGLPKSTEDAIRRDGARLARAAKL